MNSKNFLFMKIKMFITSYLPLYIILLILQGGDYQFTWVISKIDIKATICVVILSILIAISIICTMDMRSTEGNEKYKFSKIERTGDTVISYMMTYIVPLLSGDFLSFNGLTVNITLFLLIAIMYIKLDLVYFNPIWLILGYAVYETDKGSLIISNISYGRLKQNENIALISSYLVKGVYLIQKRDNIF